MISQCCNKRSTRNISAWVQESGRAGRNGNPATATIFCEEGDADHAGASIKDYIRNPPVRDESLTKFGESWNFIYAGLAGCCRRRIITQEFREPHSNSVGMNGLCCDICTELSSKEPQNLVQIQPVKLTLWIRGNTRPWMKTLNKSSTSFANSCGHSEGW